MPLRGMQPALLHAPCQLQSGGRVAARLRAVLQYGGVHARCEEPHGDGLRLARGLVPVPAARTDDDHRPLALGRHILLRREQVEAERRGLPGCGHARLFIVKLYLNVHLHALIPPLKAYPSQ